MSSYIEWFCISIVKIFIECTAIGLKAVLTFALFVLFVLAVITIAVGPSFLAQIYSYWWFLLYIPAIGILAKTLENFERWF